MFWADRIADEIIKSGKHKLYWVDDMKTPSGRVHVGALRGVVVHDLIYQALHEKGKKATYTYVFNDMDPMDGFPHYLPEEFKQYMGKPLFQIPSPEDGYDSMARCYGQQFIDVFNQLGSNPKIIWSSEYYKQGKFNDAIRVALDKVDLVRKLYKEISKYDKPSDWYPFQVICPECGKVGSTIVSDWNGEEVSYTCQKDLVTWVQGCGHTGKISPFDGNGKLMWKVDWAAHWNVIGITIEGAGKDHMTEGGSHDLSSALCEQVFEYPTPHTLIYEWFLARGGKKMSSSKGVGVSASDMSKTMPPELLRFLLVRTPYRKAIIFDPSDNATILDLFDEYDQFAAKYYAEGEKSDYGRIWKLSQIGNVSKKSVFMPRFRDVVNYVQQPKVDVYKKFEETKGSKFTRKDTEELEKRMHYAKIWIKHYAPEEKRLTPVENIPEAVNDFSDKQREYLSEVAKLVSNISDPEELQKALYQETKDIDISPKQAFAALYTAFLNKSHGPKAAWFLLSLDKDFVLQRLKDAQVGAKEEEVVYQFDILGKPEIFTIDPEVRKRYPSAIVGLAIIKGVTVRKSDPNLQKEIDAFIASQSDLTNQKLGEYPELQSYRKIYKEMGIDWHSRRPSPEALLRRIAQGRELYSINTCVDSYNLVVMKRRVSAGAFNLDKIKFPTILRFAKEGDQITLLGDSDITKYKPGEIAYFDSLEGYNMDFNWRDSERTKVDENTKNLWINIEGVYSITRQQVEQSLQEVIDIITKYCGGTVEMAGIMTA